MKWEDLEKPWQECFEMGWESLKRGSVPIGAVITNEEGEIISKGRNMIFEDNGDLDVIARHRIGHAEMNAILKVNEFDHPNIRKYTIYTTTEPCPMCFGTIVMVNIRHIRFAARDRYAGGTELNDMSAYIKSKNISIIGPHNGLEDVQVAIHSAFELERYSDRLLNVWRIDSPAGVDLGVSLYREGILKKLVADNVKASVAFDTISEML